MGYTRFTIDGYNSFGDAILSIDRKEDLARNCFPKFMTELNMKKLILFTGESDDKYIKDFENLLRSNKIFDFGSDKLIVINYQKMIEAGMNGIFEIAKWYFDRSYIKFYLLPLISEKFEIWGVFGTSQKKLITAEQRESIPFTKSVIAPKTYQKCFMSQYCYQYHSDKNEVIETLEMNDQKCHQQKITFKIESECFPELIVEPVILPEIQGLPKKLDEIILEEKIPIITFFGHSSVICVCKNDGYTFLDSWNGLYGKELVINFDQAKPYYGMDSIKVDKTKMSAVVYDLIKIMSMPSDAFIVNENWKFEVAKDSENAVIIEFESLEGKQKSTPAFLMAMILKEQIKYIKTEMGIDEKPKKIGFCVFQKISEAEKKRVEAGLEESCKLLKIACKFILV
uniref:Uncharacterized protein n=1 Tax=Panagrolaimus sp. ES5 TaxID=591445 RepID=A0AC34FC00_9BILA